VWHIWETGGVYIDVGERDHLGDLGLDGRII